MTAKKNPIPVDQRPHRVYIVHVQLPSSNWRGWYVGTTSQTLKARLSAHLGADSYKKTDLWNTAITKMFAAGIGKDRFKIEQLGPVYPDGPTARIAEAGVIERCGGLQVALFSGGIPTVGGGDRPTDATLAKKRASKPYRGPVRDTETGEVFASIGKAAAALGVSKSIISEHIRGKRQTAGGRRLEKAT